MGCTTGNYLLNMQLFYISRLRILFTIIVVVYHALCPFSVKWGNEGNGIYPLLPFYNWLAVFLGNIHMAFFTFVAGYLFRYQYCRISDFRSLIVKKSRRLLIPYLFWGIILFLTLDYTYLDLVKGISHLWFLLMLFWCFVVGYIFLKFRRYRWIIGIFTVVANLLSSFVPEYLAFKNLVGYLPYFIIGMLIEGSFWHRGIKERYKLWLLISSVALICLAFFNLNILTFGSTIDWILKAILKVGGRIFIVCTFLIALFEVFSASGNAASSGIKRWERYSFPVYILHHWLLLLMLANADINMFYASHPLYLPILVGIILLISVLFFRLYSFLNIKNIL